MIFSISEINVDALRETWLSIFSRRWTLLVDVSIDQSLSLPARYHYEINNSKLVMDSAIVKHVQILHTWKIPRYQNATGLIFGPFFSCECYGPRLRDQLLGAPS